MWLVPWAVGAGVGGGLDGRQLLLLVALLAAFLANHQAATWYRLRLGPRPDRAGLTKARQRFLALAAVAVLSATPLVLLWRLTALVPFGLLGATLTAGSLVLVHRHRERGVLGQLIAPVGLSLTAAIGHYVASGAVERVGVALWSLCALFLLGGVVYVRLKIRAIPRAATLASPTARLALATPTLVALVAIVLAAGFVVWTGGLCPRILLAFVPVAIQALVGTVRLDRPAVLKRVGIVSTVHAALFGLLVIGLA